MPVLSLIGSIFGFASTFVSGLFGFKGDQAKTVQSALDLLKSVNDVDGQAITASASAISSILTQGSWLERNWRPALMILLIIIVGSWYFGYIPPHFNDPVSPMMDRVLTMLTIGVGGYVPCRTLEKIVTQFNIAAILKKLIEKKLA